MDCSIVIIIADQYYDYNCYHDGKYRKGSDDFLSAFC